LGQRRLSGGEDAPGAQVLNVNRRSEVRRLNVAVVLVALLAASLTAAGVANAVGIVAPTKVTAAVLPKHINPPSIKKANYTYHARGTIVPPKQICPSGVAPPSPYCTKVPKSACSGTVSWIAKIGKNSLLAASNKEVAHGKAPVRSCAYRFSHHFPASLFIANRHLGGFSSSRHVGVLFYIHFNGNSVLKPRNARRQTVIAKVLEQGI
jgi:hypothetical protein